MSQHFPDTCPEGPEGLLCRLGASTSSSRAEARPGEGTPRCCPAECAQHALEGHTVGPLCRNYAHEPAEYAQMPAESTRKCLQSLRKNACRVYAQVPAEYAQMSAQPMHECQQSMRKCLQGQAAYSGHVCRLAVGLLQRRQLAVELCTSSGIPAAALRVLSPYHK
eukprot:1145780-Pelagomonas_calceolata.AAC.3